MTLASPRYVGNDLRRLYMASVSHRFYGLLSGLLMKFAISVWNMFLGMEGSCMLSIAGQTSDGSHTGSCVSTVAEGLTDGCYLITQGSLTVHCVYTYVCDTVCVFSICIQHIRRDG